MISIIIPVYNSEAYLKQCLDSIINQTYKETEIICVDDGSRDNSLNILKEYAGNDSRVKVLEQNNLGVGVARNHALKNANGQYIMFVDSDDRLVSDALEKIYLAAKNNNADVVQFNQKIFDENTNKISKYNLADKIDKLYNFDLRKIGSFNYKDICNNCFHSIDMHVMSRMYRSDFLKANEICFQNCRYGEDWIFSIKVLLTAEKIYYLDKYCYFYRVRKNSLSHRKSKYAFEVFSNIKEVETFLKQENLYNILNEQFIAYRQALLKYSRKHIPLYLLFIFDLKVIFNYSYKTYKNIKTGNSLIKNIFSITNSKDKKHKILTVFYTKIKFKR